MQEVEIKECQKYLLNLAIQFDKICRENKIPYYMLGGTMLGAVRHKGFIPWDDDMDFGVPREYFPQMLELLKENLPDYIRINTIDNSGMIFGFIKLDDSRTVIKEKFKENDTNYWGINIDIFPLDKISNSNTHIFSDNWIIDKIIKIQNYLFLSYSDRPFSKRQLAKIVQMLNPSTKFAIINYVEKKIAKLSKGKANYIANFYGSWGMKETVKMDVFDAPALYKFENIELYGVKKQDEYLKSLYNDYMKLPPESDRYAHSTDFFIK
ncbi:MAG: LicD family protein [Candidatus Symbiothrix sp.]|jgi:lipopolysaccharide cholinephosphotransferase|nr:LicD family protein [Candidatus Symbiothrix sp.]